MGTLQDMVEPHTMGRILSAGATLSAIALAATVAVTGWMDLAMVGLAGAIGLGTLAAAQVRRTLDHLPLRLATGAAVGTVDGRDLVRFRACLGRGRRFVPTVQVALEADGAKVPVAVVHPDGSAAVCGPLVVTVERPAQSGVLVVSMEAMEDGHRWTAEARYPTEALLRGRFAHGVHVGACVVFDTDWDRIEIDDDPAPGA